MSGEIVRRKDLTDHDDTPIPRIPRRKRKRPTTAVALTLTLELLTENADAMA
jgi:hypothetical protein